MPVVKEILPTQKSNYELAKETYADWQRAHEQPIEGTPEWDRAHLNVGRYA